MQTDDAFDLKYKISNGIYYAVLLHDHPELINECCELINMEWKRSHMARLRSISGSSNEFPTSVLLLKESKKPEIIGHCKLTKLSRSSPVVFVETVVIHPQYRGKGLGRLLMQKAESFVKSKGIKCLYLTTVDKQLFYQKLGYSFCQPINIYGEQLNDTFSFKKKDELIPQENTLPIGEFIEKEKLFRTSLSNIFEQPMAVSPASLPKLPLPPPPPPPPPPPISSFRPNMVPMTNKKTFMKKNIV